MTHEIEEELEEDDVIHPIDDELDSLIGPPLMGGHLPFDDMGITPPLEGRVMDICNAIFDQLKKMIVEQR